MYIFKGFLETIWRVFSHALRVDEQKPLGYPSASLFFVPYFFLSTAVYCFLFLSTFLRLLVFLTASLHTISESLSPFSSSVLTSIFLSYL